MRSLISTIQGIGLSVKLQPMTLLKDEPDFPAYIASSSWSGNALGFGIDLDKDVAKEKAVGELLERFALQRDLPKDRRQMVAGESDTCMSMFVDQTIADGDYLSWWPAQRKNTKAQKWLPAQLLFTGPGDEKPMLDRRRSDGTALSNGSAQQGEISAFLELYERAIVSESFYGNTPWTEITELEGDCQRVSQRIQDNSINPRIFLANSENGIFVVFVLAIDRLKRGLALSAGSAAGENLNLTVTKALIESIQGRSPRRKFFSSRNIENLYSQLGEGVKRAYYWSVEENAETLNIEGKIGNSRTFRNVLAHENPALAAIKEVMSIYDLYQADITPTLLQETDIEVIRILEPTLSKQISRNLSNTTLPWPFN